MDPQSPHLTHPRGGKEAALVTPSLVHSAPASLHHRRGTDAVSGVVLIGSGGGGGGSPRRAGGPRTASEMRPRSLADKDSPTTLLRRALPPSRAHRVFVGPTPPTPQTPPQVRRASTPWPLSGRDPRPSLPLRTRPEGRSGGWTFRKTARTGDDQVSRYLLLRSRERHRTTDTLVPVSDLGETRTRREGDSVPLLSRRGSQRPPTCMSSVISYRTCGRSSLRSIRIQLLPVSVSSVLFHEVCPDRSRCHTVSLTLHGSLPRRPCLPDTFGNPTHTPTCRSLFHDNPHPSPGRHRWSVETLLQRVRRTLSPTVTLTLRSQTGS